MNRFSLTIALTAIISLTACKNNDKSTTGEIPLPESAAPLPVPSTQTETETTGNENIATPVQAAPVTARLNPEHGQPGHRCDIAVGAPLDSKPAVTTSNPAPQPTITNTTPSISPNNNTQPVTLTTPPGINPPHGQPGHRCDIQVGDSLNKPAAAAIKPTTTNVTPLKPDTSNE